MVVFNLARPPAAPPDPLASHLSRRATHRHIIFRHPWYHDANNVLLKLYASDIEAGVHGLYAQFALDACGIVTGNRWDGWLSRSRDMAAAKEDAGSVLREASYYFHLPDASPDVPYAIVPTFREWRFPHGTDGAQLPIGWRDLDLEHGGSVSYARSDFASAVRHRDQTCRMSGCRVSAQVAHLCPVKEQEWIETNSMHRYNRSGEPDSNDVSNLLLLRADLHIEFDRNGFVFVAKRATKRVEDSGEYGLMVHVLKEEEELEREYQNVALQLWTGAGPGVEWMFTRFAWSIFLFLGGFLAGKVSRRVRVYNQDGEAIDEMMSAQVCLELAARTRGGKSRSQSPQKRPRDGTNQEIEKEESEVVMSENMEERPRERLCRPDECGRGDHQVASSRVGEFALTECDTPASRSSVGPADGQEQQSEADGCRTCASERWLNKNEEGMCYQTFGQLKRDWLKKGREELPDVTTQWWMGEQEWARQVSKEERVLTVADAERWAIAMSG